MTIVVDKYLVPICEGRISALRDIEIVKILNDKNGNYLRNKSGNITNPYFLIICLGYVRPIFRKYKSRHFFFIFL